MDRVVTVSFTPLDAPGGVPRWNRDIAKSFKNTQHFSWWDSPWAHNGAPYVPEWEKAKLLSTWLVSQKLVTEDDVILADGFWADGFNKLEHRVVSVCHGIWSHLIKEEADVGTDPDMPRHHDAQVRFRKRFSARGGKMVAVSEFIRHQMDIQWGFDSEVINNAIDTEEWRPYVFPRWADDALIAVHGVNDRGNRVKGWDHIQACIDEYPDVEFLSLDELTRLYSRPGWHKRKVFGLADFCLIPSSYEGNSYFALEAMACGLPVVAYDVGLFWEMSPYNRTKPPEDRSVGDYSPGVIMSRKERSIETTLEAVKLMIEMLPDSEFRKRWLLHPRAIAERHSVERFGIEWRNYLKKEFNYAE